MAEVRRIITFDVPDGPIGPYDAADALARLRRLAGVQSVALLEAASGTPAYLLEIVMDPAAAEPVDREMALQLREQGAYLANVVSRQFRPLA